MAALLGTLLTRAVEIWATEEGEEDELPVRQVVPSIGGGRRSTNSQRRDLRPEAAAELSTGRKVEMHLDQDANDILEMAMNRRSRGT